MNDDERKSAPVLSRYFTAPLLVLALTAPALAQPHVIAELGSAPLIGQIDSTQTLQTDVARNEQLFETAGTQLGLSASEYAQVRDRIATSRVSYVTIPRHLDAMTWSLNGRVKVLRDVIIPANTKGWEVDVKETGQIVAVFIPNKCGNLSVVRRPAPVVAALPTRVKASHYAPPAKPVAEAPVQPAATAAPVAEAPAATAPEATPAPYTTIASNTAPAPAAASGHHFPWFLLLIPVIALVGGHGGSSGGGGITTATVPPGGGGGPTPPPVSCPTPAPPH